MYKYKFINYKNLNLLTLTLTINQYFNANNINITYQHDQQKNNNLNEFIELNTSNIATKIKTYKLDQILSSIFNYKKGYFMIDNQPFKSRITPSFYQNEESCIHLCKTHEELNFLYKHNCDIYITDKNGYTLLHKILNNISEYMFSNDIYQIFSMYLSPNIDRNNLLKKILNMRTYEVNCNYNLLELSMKILPFFYSDLHSFIESNQFKIFNNILTAFIDLNYKGSVWNHDIKIKRMNQNYHDISKLKEAETEIKVINFTNIIKTYNDAIKKILSNEYISKYSKKFNHLSNPELQNKVMKNIKFIIKYAEIFRDYLFKQFTYDENDITFLTDYRLAIYNQYYGLIPNYTYLLEQYNLL